MKQKEKENKANKNKKVGPINLNQNKVQT